ncbi:MAG TPA: DNA primase, partial [Acidimicrobiales bacterium]|nr:DNA primase [Acidimicrobiales bacterium]
MAIADEDVARVRAATDIVALIGERAALKRQGRRWLGLCPFHQEKTPSFSVNAEEGFYYCFGCQQSGDAITFVRATERVDFVEAVRRLAERAGITIAEDPSVTAGRQARAKLTQAMERAVDWYHERLLEAKDAGSARDYLRSRGYDGEVVRRYKLGWAPDDWDALAKELGVSDRVLIDTGLGFVNRLGRQQDAFRARVIFPIFDPAGRPIALGGRILPPPEGSSGPGGGPKYKNSQDGPLYSKRRTLYGLNWAKQAIVNSGEAVVCEGYTDVIACFLAGVPRAVATCGTALAEEHFRLLRNFATRIVLAYDSDAAGQSGAGRVYEWERNHEVDLYVAALPSGTDPADLARSDPGQLRRAIENARPFLEFRIDRILSGSDLNTAEGRARAAEAAVAAVIEHPNDLVRDQYLMLVADRCKLDPGSVRELASRRQGLNGHARGSNMRGESRARGEAAVAGVARIPGVAGAPRVAGVSDMSRAGLEGLRLVVHNHDLIADRLESVLFAEGLERETYETLAAAASLQQAVDSSERDRPGVAELLRRLSVEEPAAEVDDVVVQLVRMASRRALSELEARARHEPESVAGLASEITKVR